MRWGEGREIPPEPTLALGRFVIAEAQEALRSAKAAAERDKSWQRWKAFEDQARLRGIGKDTLAPPPVARESGIIQAVNDRMPVSGCKLLPFLLPRNTE